MRQGPISCLRVLSTPDVDNDEFRAKRPIIAVCDSSRQANCMYYSSIIESDLLVVYNSIIEIQSLE